MKIRVLRAFYLAGEPVEPESIQEVSPTFARELIHSRKAEAVDDEELPIEPLGVQNASGLVAG
jgi:hypothetical protein